MYDETMLPDTTPGYLALNSFKHDTLAKVKAIGLSEQLVLSGNTTNPYARTAQDQYLWGVQFDYLMRNGYAGRDLYWHSLNQLSAMVLADYARYPEASSQ